MFAEHAVGGMVGLVFNAFFAADYIIGLDGVNNGMTGGFINHNWRQLYIQIAYILAATFYAFTVSALIAKAIDLVPGLHLRASEEAELLGMDDDQHGEFAYDYVEVRRDYLAWTPAEKDPKEDGVRIIPQHGIEGHQMLMNGTRPPSLAAASSADQEERIYLNSQSSNGKERSLGGSNGNGNRPQLQQLQPVSDQEDAVQSEKAVLPPSPIAQ